MTPEMMKAIKITTDGRVMPVHVTNCAENLAREIDASMIERVKISARFGFSRDFAMVIDEEGLLQNNPVCNPAASFLYATDEHGQPIMGDVLLVGEGMTDDGSDFIDPEMAKIVALYIVITDMIQMLHAVGEMDKLHLEFDGKTGDDFPPHIITWN